MCELLQAPACFLVLPQTARSCCCWSSEHHLTGGVLSSLVLHGSCMVVVFWVTLATAWHVLACSQCPFLGCAGRCVCTWFCLAARLVANRLSAFNAVCLLLQLHVCADKHARLLASGPMRAAALCVAGLVVLRGLLALHVCISSCFCSPVQFCAVLLCWRSCSSAVMHLQTCLCLDS